MGRALDNNCYVEDSDPKVKCYDSGDVNKTCVCDPGYAVKYDTVNDNNYCVEGCFSTVIGHFGISIDDLYSDVDKCTCQDEFDTATCDCLAGYTMQDGVCTNECHSAVGSNCIYELDTRAKCSDKPSGSSAACFCAPGYAAVTGSSYIDCEELAEDECNPSLSTVGCSCSDFHDITTCVCSTGYSMSRDNPSMCVKSVSKTATTVFDQNFNPKWADTSSDEFMEAKAEFEQKITDILADDGADDILRVTVNSLAAGSTVVNYDVTKEVADGEDETEAKEALAASIDSTMNSPQVKEDNGILSSSIDSDGDTTDDVTEHSHTHDDDDDDDDTDTLLIVLIVLVCVIVIITIVALIVQCVFKKKKEDQQKLKNDEFDNLYALRSVEAERHENGRQNSRAGQQHRESRVDGGGQQTNNAGARRAPSKPGPVGGSSGGSTERYL